MSNVAILAFSLYSGRKKSSIEEDLNKKITCSKKKQFKYSCLDDVMIIIQLWSNLCLVFKFMINIVDHCTPTLLSAIQYSDNQKTLE